MLMGEHAVLAGHRALACAVDKRIEVVLHSLEERELLINSELAYYRAPLNNLHAEARLSFVLEAVEYFMPQLPGGLSLTIKSGFSHRVGLGSSAAVTAAVVAALLHWIQQQKPHPELVLKEALTVVHRVQHGRGSGTDLAASIYGGLIAYQTEPRKVVPLEGMPSISLHFSGYKMTTPEVIALVSKNSSKAPALYHGLFELMHQTTLSAEQAVKEQDWSHLGFCMNVYHGLMDALGVCDQTLAEIVYLLRQKTEVLGSKISGSGLGDCVVALGLPDQPSFMPILPSHYEAIPVTISPEGVSFEYL